MPEILSQKRKKIIAIVGLAKNVGKTSFLNWYLKKLDVKLGAIGISTTGRDGEDVDLVTGMQKPKVFLPENVYFTSFDYVYNKNSSALIGIEKLPFRVLNKNLWLYKTTECIETEIVGPSTLKEQEALMSLYEKLGCETILFDGSLDRKSVCLSGKITDIVLVVGAAVGNISEIKQQAEKIKLYSEFQYFNFDEIFKTKEFGIGGEILVNYDNNIIATGLKTIYGNEKEICDILSKNPKWVYFCGALTDSSWRLIRQSVLNFRGKIIFYHPLSVSICIEELKILLERTHLCTSIRFEINTVVVNSYSPRNEHVDAELLRTELKRVFIDKEVIDITEVCVS